MSSRKFSRWRIDIDSHMFSETKFKEVVEWAHENLGLPGTNRQWFARFRRVSYWDVYPSTGVPYTWITKQKNRNVFDMYFLDPSYVTYLTVKFT